MKTASLKTLVLLFILSLVLGGTSLAMAASPITKLKVEKVKSLEVSGNVKLTLIQGANEGVQIYDTYYSKNALVQQEGELLRLSSYNKVPLEVVVTVAQLQKLSVSGTSVVDTYGPIHFLALNVKLTNKAKANLGIEAVQLITHIADMSKLKLNGFSEDFQGHIASNGQLELEHFSAHTSKVKSYNKQIMAGQNNAMDNLYVAARLTNY